MHRSLLKHRIKTGLRALGPLAPRLRPGARGHRDLHDAVAHLVRMGVRPATVIDVGVADGTYELYEAFPGAHVLLVEPLTEFEGVLRAITARHGGDYVLAAAGAERGTLEIAVGEDLHGATLLDADSAPSRRRVPVVTLDDLCAERRLRGPYLLKVDVQGAELLVLQGASRVLEEAVVVVLETSLFHFHPGMPEFAEVVEWMASRGFVVYDIVGALGRPLDGALAQVDLVFTAPDGALRAHHEFWSAEQQARDARTVVRRIRRGLGV